MKLLHKIIFWSHLLAGLVGGVVIFIMSATGVILMYEHQMVEYAERDVREVAPPSANAPRLSLDEIVAKARERNPDGRATGIMLRNEPTASVAVGFGREGATYINPYTGAVLGKGSKLHDWFHDVIDWHRWLAMEGEGRATGRAITGACNLAFFWLAVTGVYLWWPRSWQWRGLKSSLLFNFHLRGKARDWNWHNVIGFWSSAVLVVLTLTAAVMSYPWANDLLYTLTGNEPPPRAQGNSPMAQAPQQGGKGERGKREPMASFDAFLARAEQQTPGWITMMMRLPPRGDGPVNLLIQEPTAPHIFARSQLQLNRATAEVVKWEPYAAANMGRKLRIWVRGLHTGEALGVIGQTVAGLASLGGCFLVWTGFAMAWRRYRSWRREPAIAAEVTGTAVAAPATFSEQTAGSLSKSPVELGADARNGSHRAAGSNGINGSDNTGLIILYATVTGHSQSIARRAAKAAENLGFKVAIEDVAKFDLGALQQASRLLLIASTFGDGEAPNDAQPFYDAVIQGNDLDLRGTEFSVLALGDHTYDYFCKCGKDLDAALERLGATRVYPRVDCDLDFEQPAQRWIEGVLSALTEPTAHARRAS